MSQLTADHLFPLFLTLPREEQQMFVDKINKQFKPSIKSKKRRKDIYHVIGEKYRPENIEMLVSEIMNS